MLLELKYVSDTGQRTNLTFFGDIIGDVALSPLVCGYEVMRHPQTKFTNTLIHLGPVIAPNVTAGEEFPDHVAASVNSRTRATDLWKEFIRMSPTSNSFIEFAGKFGLLHSQPGLIIKIGENVLACDPLVHWFQHYSKLKLLHFIFTCLDKEEKFVADYKTLEKQLKTDVERQLNQIFKQFLGTDEEPVHEHVYSGTQVDKFFEPAGWTIHDCRTKAQLIDAAYDLLTSEISRHCHIVIRRRGKRQKLSAGDKDDIKDKSKGEVITTSLIPSGLGGALYIGLLLDISSYRIRRNVRSCSECGRTLLNEHRRTQYCSESCRQRAKRARAKKGSK